VPTNIERRWSTRYAPFQAGTRPFVGQLGLLVWPSIYQSINLLLQAKATEHRTQHQNAHTHTNTQFLSVKSRFHQCCAALRFAMRSACRWVLASFTSLITLPFIGYYFSHLKTRSSTAKGCILISCIRCIAALSFIFALRVAYYGPTWWTTLKNERARK